MDVRIVSPSRSKTALPSFPVPCTRSDRRPYTALSDRFLRHLAGERGDGLGALRKSSRSGPSLSTPCGTLADSQAMLGQSLLQCGLIPRGVEKRCDPVRRSTYPLPRQIGQELCVL